MADDNQTILDRVLTGLKSSDETREFAAIQELETLLFSSEAIVLQLEQLALQRTGEVHEAALRALLLKTSQFVSSKLSSLNRSSRDIILREIDGWQTNNIIDPSHAEVLRRRYDFDRQPGITVKAKAEPVAQAQTPAPAETIDKAPKAAETPKPLPQPKPTEPRPSLTQVLLSETSIRIYLYLGAFFVIASAAILAALVEAARLPILLVATLIFAGGAVGLKKRLSQPSFALAIVFSFLLPIDAGVIAESLNMTVSTGHWYWAAVFLVMTVIWGLGTWFYESRIFSVASFVALTLGAYRMGAALHVSNAWIVFTFGFSSMVGLFGAIYIKNWMNRAFAQPLFLTIQVLQVVSLFASLGLIVWNLYSSNVAWDTWIAHTLIWLLAASFFAVSGIVVPFVLFPWAAVGSLLLVPWLFLSAFDASAFAQIAGFGLWGALMAIGSELVNRANKKTVLPYVIPLLVISLPLFSISILWGLIEEVQYAFMAFLLTGIVYTVVHAMHPRWYVWSTALLSSFGAYLTFYALPFMDGINLYMGYQLLVAGLLLLIPELFFKEPLTIARSWNWPPVLFGSLLTTLNIFIAHVPLIKSQSDFGRASIILGVYAVLFAAYAIRFRQPLIGYFATASITLTVVYTLNHFNQDLWLPTLTALSMAYYFSGYFLVRKVRPLSWGNMFIISGLGLGTILSIIAALTLKSTGGWYIIVISALFFTEMFTRKNKMLELAAFTILNIALIIILNDFKVTKLAYYLFGSSLIWLGGDLALHIAIPNRDVHLITRLAGGAATLLAVLTITINHGLTSVPAAACFAVYAAFFAAYALIYKTPALGYLSTASAAATMFYTLDHFNIETWLPIFTGLSLVYYVAGYSLRNKSTGWSEMFRYSGLMLGSLVSVIAVIGFEPTGGWYAAIIGMLFIVETVSTQNGWFEAGVPVMLSIAVFLILRDFKINQYSYILLALSIIWLGGDMLFHRFFKERRVEQVARLIGGSITTVNAFSLLFSPSMEATICFSSYTLFFAIYALLYNQPLIGYAATVSLPLATFYGLRTADQTRWLFPVIAIVVVYYAAGYALRINARKDWDKLLLYSGIGLGTLTALLAPAQPGGIEKAIPIAITATLFAAEAFTLRNVWLAFPANAFYLISYFTLLVELKVDEPQYFSIGAALLGMLMHYLLVRAKSKSGAFVMGMISQFVLLGTSYIQLISTSQVSFFFVLFTQSLVILAYGIYMRSRSLVIAPIGIVVLAILTILYSTLKSQALVLIIGVTGIILLVLGVLAVLMRERITMLAERFSDWNA